jgi:hypothetical protein
MKSNVVCPVSDKKISEQVARLNGAFTMTLLLIFGLTKSIIPVAYLTFDFYLRGFNYPEFSFSAIASKGIVRYLNLKEHFINAGPKIFAARIGLLFSSLILLSSFFNSFLPAFSLAGVLFLFSFLESALGLCVACELYPFVYRVFYKIK